MPASSGHFFVRRADLAKAQFSRIPKFDNAFSQLQLAGRVTESANKDGDFRHSPRGGSFLHCEADTLPAMESP